MNSSSNSSNSTYETVLEVCINSLMGQIRNYTEDQLSNLLNDENRLNAMVDSMPQVSSLLMDKELKLTQSKSFAEYNLSIEPKLNEARSNLKTTHGLATKLEDEVKNLKKQLDSIAEDRSLDTISAILQAAEREAEDQSEAIAEKFQDGEIQIDEFVKEYNEKRILTHLRKIKSEKLLEILRRQQYQPIAESAYESETGTGQQHQPSRASQLPGYPNSGMSRLAGYPSLHGAGNTRHSYFR